ncbi:MAG: TrkA family potassium uptake protein [Acidiferrobacterales bacterium]
MQTDTSIVYILLRRLRAPLVVLISVYAISIIGMTLIPGVDDQGKPWRMDFFHAFYFVSFMGTTIGFGELPYAFTDAQRAWTLVTIYLTVISWLYTIGVLLRIFQDPGFRRLVDYASFTRAVRRIRDPFFIICGYGDTGSLLVRALTERGLNAVVIDNNNERIEKLETAGLPLYVPGLAADSADPDILYRAGLAHHNCTGVVALTNNDKTNLTIAITGKLIAPKTRVYCRAESHDIAANMSSFGTDYTLNPFDSFAERFAMAIHSPSMYLLYDWFTSEHRALLTEPLSPPSGEWILCGYGRFGKALQRYLASEDINITIIEADPEGTGAPADIVVGRGTEAETLEKAHIKKALGIIAGTDNDANNLSIIMTARALNPDLFTVARQNETRNDAIFNAANIDLVVERGNIIARKISALIITPLLADFLKFSRPYNNQWANILISRISGVTGNNPPYTWSIEVDETNAPAIFDTLNENLSVTLKDLGCNPRNRDVPLKCLPLMIKHNQNQTLLPEGDTKLSIGDQILYCGSKSASRNMIYMIQNYNILSYVRTGDEPASGIIWKFFTDKTTRKPS